MVLNKTQRWAEDAKTWGQSHRESQVVVYDQLLQKDFEELEAQPAANKKTGKRKRVMTKKQQVMLTMTTHKKIRK